MISHDSQQLYEYVVLTPGPLVKPVDGGSSIGVCIVRRPATTISDQIRSTFETYRQMIVEELIEGDEITVGILEDTALPVIEIIPPENGEFDYENKYNGKTQELCPPQHISQEHQQAAQELALRIHKAAGCRDLSRSDFMLNRQGQLYLLETNTIPGMTNQSLYPRMALTAGISMPELVSRFVQAALSR